MIIFTATLSLMITVVVALAGVATSSGSIHSLGGHVVLSGHELSSLSAGKLFPSPIVVRIAGLLGFSMLLGACTWRLTSRGSQQVALLLRWLIALVSGRGTEPRAGSKGRSRTGQRRAAPAATDRIVSWPLNGRPRLAPLPGPRGTAPRP